MSEIEFDTRRASVLGDGLPGLKDCPGRNDPRIGRWLIETLCAGVSAPVVVDPMCGGGQLWMTRPDGVTVLGCELVGRRVDIARANGVLATDGHAEEWTPDLVPHLVAFSPPYPNCDHDSGKTKHQRELVESHGMQSMQTIEAVPCLWRVFAQVATYRESAPVAVIVRNWIRDQIEVDWTSEVASSMAMAGLGHVERYWRAIPPGCTEQWKVSRGEYSAKTGKTHRVVEREWVLVARPSQEAIG